MEGARRVEERREEKRRGASRDLDQPRARPHLRRFAEDPGVLRGRIAPAYCRGTLPLQPVPGQGSPGSGARPARGQGSGAQTLRGDLRQREIQASLLRRRRRDQGTGARSGHRDGRQAQGRAVGPYTPAGHDRSLRNARPAVSRQRRPILGPQQGRRVLPAGVDRQEANGRRGSGRGQAGRRGVGDFAARRAVAGPGATRLRPGSLGLLRPFAHRASRVAVLGRLHPGGQLRGRDRDGSRPAQETGRRRRASRTRAAGPRLHRGVAGGRSRARGGQSVARAAGGGISCRGRIRQRVVRKHGPCIPGDPAREPARRQRAAQGGTGCLRRLDGG